MSHTPGPWAVGYDAQEVFSEPRYQSVCTVLGDVLEGPHNARLIAAAPELLEHGVHALRELDVFAALIHHQDQREEVQAIADRFRAAISKATDVQGGGR